MIDDLLKDADDRMDKAVEAIRREFATVRTGRASPHCSTAIQVDYYGAQTPLNQLAQISASEARLLTITPYDKSSIKAIEKAILESDLGLTPANDGNVIRLTIPELTEERRKELVKVVRNIAEEGRVSVRNIRRDVMHDLKELKAAGDVGEDDERRAESRAAEADRRADRRDRLLPVGQGRGGPRGLAREVRYVAIIMDGNARWAQARGLPVLAGHRQGAKALKRTVRDAVKHDVKELTVYAFSTENWSRPRDEVDGLMAMFAELIESETPGARRAGRADEVHRPPRRGLATSCRRRWTGPRRRRAATTA